MLSIEHQSRFSAARCLVTGGAGFIGSNLTRTLLGLGAYVRVVDDFSTGLEANLPQHARLEIVRDDLRRSDRLSGLVRDADYVFHLAAQVGNVKSIAAPVRDAETNIAGTVRLIEACRGARIAKFVYSSSSAIFGEAERLPIDESHRQQPASFYALSKQAAEHYTLMAADLFALPAVCLRYFNVYGLPMEDNEYTGVISIFLRRIRAGRPLTIFGDGSQVRDFVYVDDIVQANLLAALVGVSAGIYNIGTGNATSVNVLAETLLELASAPLPIEHADFRRGEVRRSVADIGRARVELGYNPRYSLRDGLALLVDAPSVSVGRSQET